jgi:hypothetical protein
VAEPDDRPWEQPGQVRRDAEPPSSLLLLQLGTASLVLGLPTFGLVICGFTPMCSFLGFGVALPLMVFMGLPAGIFTLVLARRDLAKMRAGLMDPWDYDRTDEAATRARTGVFLNGLGLLLAIGILLVWLWM